MDETYFLYSEKGKRSIEGRKPRKGGRIVKTRIAGWLNSDLTEEGGYEMYGVIALFDEKTEQIIKDIWGELKEQSISFYADEVVDRRPHITFASYNSLNKPEFIKQMDKFYVNKPKIDISFNSIGSFLNSGALYFAPIVTKELIDFHYNHHKHFEQFNDNLTSLYSPNKWIPHCTLANRLSPQKLSEAFNYCSKGNDIIYGKITEVAIIELVNKNNAPVIYSIKLEG